MATGKHPGQRFKESVGGGQPRARLVALAMSLPRQEGESNARDPDAINSRLMEWSDAALMLTDTDSDRQLHQAFEAAGLNPGNPWHWRMLMQIFAEAHFPRKDTNINWSSLHLTRLLWKRMQLDAEKSLTKKERMMKLKRWIEGEGLRTPKRTHGAISDSMSDSQVNKLLQQAASLENNRLLRAAKEHLTALIFKHISIRNGDEAAQRQTAEFAPSTEVLVSFALGLVAEGESALKG